MKLDYFLGIIAAFAIIFANLFVGFASDSDFEEVELTHEDSQMAAVELTSEDQKVSREIDPVLVQKQQDFLSKLKNELNLSKTDYKQLLNSISETNTRLNQVQDEQLTLERQLRNLDDQINLTSEKLLSVIKQITEKENEIALLYEQIEVREIALNYQKSLLADYIKVIYQQEKNYFAYGEDGQIDAFKLLLSDGTVGENLRQLDYFNLLNETAQQILAKLDGLSSELQWHRNSLTKKKSRLDELEASLTNEKQQLELQKEAKENLLQITKGRQEIYSELLEQSIDEQEAVLTDVKNLSVAVGFVEKRIEQDGADFNPDDYESLLDYKTQAIYDFQLNYADLPLGKFMWPVEPQRGISAYFRDPGYVGVFGVRHNAIDIPVYQGSPVRSALDGVVYTAKDNGYGYSYIIVAHAGGYMTVYGHMSEILVEEGQMVNVGSVIGLSGGMPGTKGAGYMTTGPHLHFEVLLNGLYVDPLDLLNLSALSEEHIVNLPEKYFDDWEEDVSKAEAELILR